MGSGEKGEWRRFAGSLPSFLTGMAYVYLTIFVKNFIYNILII